MLVLAVHARNQHIADCAGVPGPDNYRRATSITGSHDSWAFLRSEQTSGKERVLH
jgi:hypothetical protein